MKMIEAAGLTGHAFRFEAAGQGVRVGRGDPGLGPLQPALAEAERVPAQAETMAEDGCDDDQRRDRQAPAERRQDPQDGQPLHGNTFRSSSKWGPSRSVGQSPPQTIAVPCRAAAALNAAAMRG